MSTTKTAPVLMGPFSLQFLVSALEIELQAELQDTRISCSRSAGNQLPKSRGSNIRTDVGVLEVRVIKQIERFCAELHIHILAPQLGILEERDVPALEARPSHDATTRVARTVSVCRSWCEYRRVEEGGNGVGSPAVASFFNTSVFTPKIGRAH